MVERTAVCTVTVFRFTHTAFGTKFVGKLLGIRIATAYIRHLCIMIVQDFPSRTNAATPFIICHLRMGCTVVLIAARAVDAIFIGRKRHLGGTYQPASRIVPVVCSITQVGQRNVFAHLHHAELSHIIGYDRDRLVRNIRFENLRINGTVISDDMPGKPAWYKTGDMARIFIGEHVENVTFSK